MSDFQQISVIIEQVLIKYKILEKLESIQQNTLRQSKPFLNIDELAEYLQLSKNTIYTLTCKGEIPFYKRTRHLFFSKSEVDAWILDKGYKHRNNREIKSMATLKRREVGQSTKKIAKEDFTGNLR